ncbi:helix-turn-helix domain-containing protein [Klebsiella pneumoniae]|nr:helix-turn-helix domain-containing protein [Klebsiella pneumoniae]
MNNKNNIATLWKDEEYTIVPSALYQRCKRLNEATALFYCRLMDDYLNETKNYGKEYFPRIKELAIKFRVDEKTIKSRLKLLVELGLVIQTPNKGYANFLEVVNFQELNILDGTDVKEDIAIHRGQRKAERVKQHQEWLDKQSPSMLTPEPLRETPEALSTPPVMQAEGASQSEPVIEQFYSEPIIQNKSDDLIITELNTLADELGYDWNVEGLLDLYKLSGIESCKNQMKDRMSLDAANDNHDWSSKYSNHPPVI